jgi:redox-sensitive bicupin YhaK (pirin superfamily)
MHSACCPRTRPIEDLSDVDTVVDLVVGPRLRPLEGLTVNRVWPTPRRRLIGPFIFLDHMQSVLLPAGAGLDVPPHPHIGLATVTYLFDGELLHADSLGMRQVIRPGELNWMTAGRGITHSERTTDADRAAASRLHGIQAWVALPRAAESMAPVFEHVAAEALPLIARDGVELRLMAGEAYGARAPVATASPLFYADAHLTTGASLELPPELGDRGVYIVAGRIGIDGRDYAAGQMLVLAAARPCRIHAQEPSRVMLLGGAPLDGDRAIWWNFVASDPATIEQAKADWVGGRFPQVPGDDGYMPLPA